MLTVNLFQISKSGNFTLEWVECILRFLYFNVHNFKDRVLVCLFHVFLWVLGNKDNKRPCLCRAFRLPFLWESGFGFRFDGFRDFNNEGISDI